MKNQELLNRWETRHTERGNTAIRFSDVCSHHACGFLHIYTYIQQFGNFQNHDEMRKAKKDRGQFGRFYYRFPQGESGLDVYTRVSALLMKWPVWLECMQRMSDDGSLVGLFRPRQHTQVTSFISTMFRDFADGHICRPDLNVIIITHGLTLRLVSQIKCQWAYRSIWSKLITILGPVTHLFYPFSLIVLSWL